MLDIDHLKQINYTFGHEAGDTFLCEFASYIQSNIRAEDVACRYGGDEFTIMLPAINQQTAYERAKQLRKGLRKFNVHNRGNLLGGIHVSIGIACYSTHSTDGCALLNTADRALYRAKNQGRDQVILAGNSSIACVSNPRYKENELPKQVGYINLVRN